MKNIMRYKGYIARIEYDGSASVFSGEVLGLSDEIRFHGAGVDELRADFEFAIDHYLAACKDAGIAPEHQASGRILLRLPPESHAAAVVAARATGVSLNEWLVRAVEGGLTK